MCIGSCSGFRRFEFETFTKLSPNRVHRIRGNRTREQQRGLGGIPWPLVMIMQKLQRKHSQTPTSLVFIFQRDAVQKQKLDLFKILGSRLARSFSFSAKVCENRIRTGSFSSRELQSWIPKPFWTWQASFEDLKEPWISDYLLRYQVDFLKTEERSCQRLEIQRKFVVFCRKMLRVFTQCASALLCVNVDASSCATELLKFSSSQRCFSRLLPVGLFV